MAPERALPEKRNPIFDAERTPERASHSCSPFAITLILATDTELTQRRRLGQTTLLARLGQVGTSNATKPENLGSFEYAHLKVPLPDNLEGSEIFSTPHPEAYFLMVRSIARSALGRRLERLTAMTQQRRSSDGLVSATGMFKATYPWAKAEEERIEREFIKALPTTAHAEVAGNVWITESAGTPRLLGIANRG